MALLWCQQHSVYTSQASEGVRDIMHRMLTPDPKERITVAQIMAHPWFCTDLPSGVTELNETLLATAAAAEVDDYDASCSLNPGVSEQLAVLDSLRAGPVGPCTLQHPSSVAPTPDKDSSSVQLC